jgi:type I restriction-modification system DNA methylase subunit
MKPRSEKDCPQCRKARESGEPPQPACSRTPTPWSEKKSTRGRKKTVCTRHHFCSNPDCDYYLITDDKIHALVGYGKHGKYEDIQGFCKSATFKEVEDNNFVLTPGRYVGTEDIEDDGISFEDKIAVISENLKSHFEQSILLQERIKENLKKVGIAL